MIIYTLMFVYVFLIGYLGRQFVAEKGIQTKYNSKVTFFIAFLIMALPVFFIGMRTNYIDTKAYIAGFEAVSSNWGDISIELEDTKSRGWLIYQWFIKRFITQNANVFLMITAIIQAGALLKLYYRYSVDYSYSVLLFFLSCSFVNMMNGIRQFLAVTLILYFAEWIFEKKYIRFMLIVLIAFSIHVSAIVWLPMIFIVHGKPFNKKTVLFSVLIMLAVLFVTEFTGLLEESLTDTDYAGYTEQFSSDDGSNIVHTIIALVPAGIAFIYRKKIIEIDDKNANIMVNISMVAVMINLLANFTSGILIGRMPIYFTVFNYVLLPWLFDNVFDEANRKTIRFLCTLGYVAYALYYMFNSWGSMGMPYISDILGINTWH